MRSILPLFPGGIAGVGLLVLRLSVAISLIAVLGLQANAEGVVQVATVFVAAGLCVGVWTRLLAGLCLATTAYGIATGATPSIVVVLHLLTAVALALTGPGAFSIDARVFGHRTVRVPGDDTIV